MSAFAFLSHGVLGGGLDLLWLRCIGQARSTSNDKVSILVVKGPEAGLWLTNETDEIQLMKAGELAGFNTGSYAEKALRVAKAMDQALPWVLEKDYDLVVLAGESGKVPYSFADLACFMATQQGVTELSVTDHDVAAAACEDFA